MHMVNFLLIITSIIILVPNIMFYMIYLTVWMHTHRLTC